MAAEMATPAGVRGSDEPAAHVAPFEPQQAATVAGWIRNDHELFWLAPTTLPPITPEKVIGWSNADRHTYLFWLDALPCPIGYAELGRMAEESGHLWLGHFLLCPAYRGRRLASTFLKLLMTTAVRDHNARRMSLVVFPANLAAVRCYQRENFVIADYERRRFETTGRYHRMLRMVLDLTHWPMPTE